jgi:transcriptional regulator with XRE-family HTH domain
MDKKLTLKPNLVPKEYYSPLSPEDIVVLDFISLIEERRRIMRISLSRLSALLGNSPAYMANLINESRIPTIETLFKLSTILSFDYKSISTLNPFIFIGDERADDETFPDYYDVDKLSPDLISEIELANESIQDMYMSFKKSKWFKEQNETDEYSYTINLGKEYNTCTVADNLMRNANIVQYSKVLFDKDGFSIDGDLYCCSIEDGPKVIRRIFNNEDTYLVCTDSLHKLIKPIVLSKDDISIYGKVVYIITPNK